MPREFERVAVRTLLADQTTYHSRGDIRSHPSVLQGQQLDAEYDASLHFIDQRWINIGNVLLKSLKSYTNRSDLSIILLGSGVNGGQLAQASGIKNPTSPNDFDWVLLSDSPLTQYQIDIIRSVEYEVIPSVGTQYFDSNHTILPCSSLTGSRLQLPNLHSVEDAVNIISTTHPDRAFVWGHPIMYFYPSLPETTNNKNIDLLLAGLKTIYVQNPQAWKLHVGRFINMWNYTHAIKGPTDSSKVIPTGTMVFKKLITSTGEPFTDY